MVTFEVNDMTCGHCVSAITKALRATDQGAIVEIDLPKHRVRLEPVSAGAGDFAAAIKDAGYTPVPVQASAVAPAVVKSACCGGCR